MKRCLWLTALTLPLVAASMADAEIIKGVMAVRGAEMS
jgi:hypothetical protein